MTISDDKPSDHVIERAQLWVCANCSEPEIENALLEALLFYDRIVRARPRTVEGKEVISDDHIHRTGPRDFYWHRLQEMRCVYCENTALRNALESKINQVDDLLAERLNSRALMDRAAKAEAERDALKQEAEKLLEALKSAATTASDAYRARRF